MSSHCRLLCICSVCGSDCFWVLHHCTTVSRFEGRDIAKFGWIRFNKIRCSETTRAAAAEQSSKGNDSFGREPFMTPRREAFVAGFHGTFV